MVTFFVGLEDDGVTDSVPQFKCLTWFVSATQAETRAEFAERSVAKLEKTIDDLEGRLFLLPFISLLELYSASLQTLQYAYIKTSSSFKK